MRCKTLQIGHCGKGHHTLGELGKTRHLSTQSDFVDKTRNGAGASHRSNFGLILQICSKDERHLMPKYKNTGEAMTGPCAENEEDGAGE